MSQYKEILYQIKKHLECEFILGSTYNNLELNPLRNSRTVFVTGKKESLDAKSRPKNEKNKI